MGIQYEGDSNDEILRLTRENNRMLRAMRRNSLMGAIFKTVMWLALILVPLWYYVTYVMPLMQGMMETFEQVQGSSAQAQAQFGQMNEYLEKLRQLGGF